MTETIEIKSAVRKVDDIGYMGYVTVYAYGEGVQRLKRLYSVGSRIVRPDIQDALTDCDFLRRDICAANQI